MYINTFKYTPADVDCKLCTEYVKKFGCTACGCPWMAERIEAGVVGYAEVVRQMFPHDKRLMARLEPLIRDFPGMLWKDERHRQRAGTRLLSLRSCSCSLPMRTFTAAPETACAGGAQSSTMQGSMRFRPMTTPSISLRGASTPTRVA